MKNEKAIVLFSGGIDSTTVLYWAVKEFGPVIAVIINYAQRHYIEIQMAQQITRQLGLKTHVIEFPLKNIVFSALIDEDRTIPDSLANSKNEAGVPYTYVPFRNGIFLSLAAAFAESREIFNIVTGFNLIDTPDYPDTTEAFTKKMEDAINQGSSAAITGKTFSIHTPLIKKSKKEILQLGFDLGVDYSYSISCYRGGEIPCLKCPSCDIRSTAFQQLNREDPLITRLKQEGRL